MWYIMRALVYKAYVTKLSHILIFTIPWVLCVRMYVRTYGHVNWSTFTGFVNILSASCSRVSKWKKFIFPEFAASLKWWYFKGTCIFPKRDFLESEKFIVGSMTSLSTWLNVILLELRLIIPWIPFGILSRSWW